MRHDSCCPSNASLTGKAYLLLHSKHFTCILPYHAFKLAQRVVKADSINGHREQRGTIHLYLLWSLNKVLCGLDHLSPNVTLSPQQVADRYVHLLRCHETLFETESDYDDNVEDQENAASDVNSEQALLIVSGEIDPIGH